MTRFFGVLATTVGTLLSIVTVSLELVLLFGLQSPALSAAAADAAATDTCRLVVGRQFAAGLPTYVLGFLLSSYLFVDSILLFVVDVTFGLRKKELKETATMAALKTNEETDLSNWELAIKSIEETTEAVRWTRLLVAGALWVLLFVSRVAVAAPYMTDPSCPAVDVTVTVLGLVNLVLMALVIVAVPFVRAAKWTEHRWIDDYKTRTILPDPTKPIPGATVRSTLWTVVIFGGLLLSLAGQWALCIALGNGWGTSIADPGSSTATTQEWTDAWLNKATTIAVVSLLSGILISLGVGRWMFSMISKLNVILLSVWAGLMLVGLIGLVLVEGGDPTPTAATAICSQTELEEWVCLFRYWMHTAGVGIVLLTLLVILFLCLLRNCRVILGIKTPTASADTATIPGKEQYPLLVMPAQR